ncbi:hypothetical protein O0235_13680 [Tepidiforma flava]|uniref:Lytic transglycosylase domain-containing protein n=1 Tax=Tepidiforma flava TaxID=3004094 RepID=A0ABY7M6N6_9CHLR|nr:hypothetical protein [Tepidiforma flava]WBL35802.1 hypothetical protein O0235_13680 [Tepidiforma flava]
MGVRRDRRPLTAAGFLAAALLLASSAFAAGFAAEPSGARGAADPGEGAAGTAPEGLPRFLTLDELDRYARMAGWPDAPGWWPEMRRIILCETANLDREAFNPQDPNGGSFGLAQLNGRYHFDRAGEDFRRWSDPVVNLRTALWLRTVRGRFGGEGGWANCAALLGIH